MTVAAPPLDVGRSAAARAAARELSRGVYRQGPGSWPAAVLRRLGAALARLLGGTGGHAGVAGAILTVVAVVVLAALAVGLRRVGTVRRTVRLDAGPLPGGPGSGAAGLRAAADAAAGGGDWSAAVLLGFRAVVQDLAERDIVHPTPATTADELAAAAAPLLGSAADALRSAAAVFGAVAYGYRVAGPDDADVVRAAGAAVADGVRV